MHDLCKDLYRESIMENITACMENEKFSPIILFPMVLIGNKM